ncbi:ribonuclease HI [Chloroflexus sp.]|uniref:ribonuclease HI n=1 Tax=Chloroflexus sp. TaxID=1904827 RepID=UPI002ACD6F15|nr:ribonuclease HI [Chloroflexus sp.]
MSQKQQYYLVVRGRQPGLYQQWQGANGAQAQVDGFPNALYKRFATLVAAREWVATLPPAERAQAQALLPAEAETPVSPTDTPAGTVVMYTDGSAIGNPGPGGYGVVLRYNSHYKELSGGFRHTTNNRMEIMACIAGLRALKRPIAVTIRSDSEYVVQAMQKRWVRRWQANNWMRNESEPVKNADLWAELLALCERHQVTFVRVSGHSGVPDNERCHELALAAAQQPDLPPDEGFVAA